MTETRDRNENKSDINKNMNCLRL